MSGKSKKKSSKSSLSLSATSSATTAVSKNDPQEELSLPEGSLISQLPLPTAATRKGLTREAARLDALRFVFRQGLLAATHLIPWATMSSTSSLSTSSSSSSTPSKSQRTKTKSHHQRPLKSSKFLLVVSSPFCVSLADVMKNDAKQRFGLPSVLRPPSVVDEKERIRLGEIQRALTALTGFLSIFHRKNEPFGALSLSSILVDPTGAITVAPPSVAIPTAASVQHEQGTPLAPETAKDDIVSPTSDCWALGAMLFELVGRVPLPVNPLPKSRVGFSSGRTGKVRKSTERIMLDRLARGETRVASHVLKQRLGPDPVYNPLLEVIDGLLVWKSKDRWSIDSVAGSEFLTSQGSSTTGTGASSSQTAGPDQWWDQEPAPPTSPSVSATKESSKALDNTLSNVDISAVSEPHPFLYHQAPPERDNSPESDHRALIDRGDGTGDLSRVEAEPGPSVPYMDASTVYLTPIKALDSSVVSKRSTGPEPVPKLILDPLERSLDDSLSTRLLADLALDESFGGDAGDLSQLELGGTPMAPPEMTLEDALAAVNESLNAQNKALLSQAGLRSPAPSPLPSRPAAPGGNKGKGMKSKNRNPERRSREPPSQQPVVSDEQAEARQVISKALEALEASMASMQSMV